jgi:hypothetical protein
MTPMQIERADCTTWTPSVCTNADLSFTDDDPIFVPALETPRAERT